MISEKFQTEMYGLVTWLYKALALEGNLVGVLLQPVHFTREGLKRRHNLIKVTFFNHGSARPGSSCS